MRFMKRGDISSNFFLMLSFSMAINEQNNSVSKKQKTKKNELEQAYAKFTKRQGKFCETSK